MKKRPTDRRPMYIGDPRTAMDIFWGGKGGYSSLRTTKLPTVGADDCTIADLNGDGWLDIAVTSYHSGDHRHHPGYIYWNSRDGFSESCRDLIPMNAGCGILAVDLNRDGYQDLVWANHTIVGNHRSYVSVAYGSADGLGLNEALKLPAFGPHYFNFADIGNVFDRSARFDYVSPAFDAGPGVRFERIRWEADTPFETGLELQIRTAPTREALEEAPWTGPTSSEDYYRQPGTAIPPHPSGHRWVQYKASLISPNQANSPVLTSVSIEYRPAAQSALRGADALPAGHRGSGFRSSRLGW